MLPTKATSYHVHQQTTASKKFARNVLNALIEFWVNFDHCDATEHQHSRNAPLTTTYFNKLGENFIATNRQNRTALYREYAETTKNDTFEETFTRLVLENGVFIGEKDGNSHFRIRSRSSCCQDQLVIEGIIIFK